MHKRKIESDQSVETYLQKISMKELAAENFQLSKYLLKCTQKLSESMNIMNRKVEDAKISNETSSDEKYNIASYKYVFRDESMLQSANKEFCKLRMKLKA